MDDTKPEELTDVDILQRECDTLAQEISALENEVAATSSEIENSDNSIAVLVKEHSQLTQELKDNKRTNGNMMKHQHSIDAAIPQAMKRYKEMRLAEKQFSSKREKLVQLVIETNKSISNFEKENKTLVEHRKNLLERHEMEVQQVRNLSKRKLASLRTQLKFSETQKMTLESQVDQKIEGNKELTKICEELIGQRE